MNKACADGLINLCLHLDSTIIFDDMVRSCEELREEEIPLMPSVSEQCTTRNAELSPLQG
jgi:hypothetical protein